MPLEARSLRAWIASQDGLEISQYRAYTDDDTIISCFIPSEAGKTFTIKLERVGGPVADLKIALHMDGHFVHGGIFSRRYSALRTIDSARVSSTTRSLFRFSEISVADGDNGHPLPFNRSKLGIIEVKLFRITVKEFSYSKGQLPSVNYSVVGDESVCEKAKVACSHRVALDKPFASAPIGKFINTCRDPEDMPYVTFRFHYRPKAILQAQRIMPLSNPPEELRSSPKLAVKDKKRGRLPAEDEGPAAKRPSLLQGSSRTNKNHQTREHPAKTGRNPSVVIKKEDELIATGNNGRLTVLEAMLRSSQEALKATQHAVMASQSALQIVQAELQTLKSQKSMADVKFERPPSPILVGKGNGDLIDLTQD
ncbi:hypothetical protein EW146_g4422 [Bondarzewia mesenterica]|uniref:DUF7918 domain-containing protein n=1 Tax=Bondarzewia mesenterica TaxID=1095465 RepID=A0A4S4LVQ8_9AGAM|nr:hypothetical protein EW146_g4422 [Bondarzewia mesenterica]